MKEFTVITPYHGPLPGLFELHKAIEALSAYLFISYEDAQHALEQYRRGQRAEFSFHYGQLTGVITAHGVKE